MRKFYEGSIFIMIKAICNKIISDGVGCFHI